MFTYGRTDHLGGLLKILFTLSLFVLIFQVGCGDSSSSGGKGSQELDASYNANGGVCGSEVVIAYNRASESCANPVDSYEINRCRQDARSFLGRFPNANCRVSGSHPERYIFASDVQSMIP